ncbi:MAG: sporulation protein [Oscillospiraceae bacterium]|nr:sporulation protein [Oscillospiraceae bacterium]
MENGKRKEGLLERTAQIFDIPGETVGLPRVEITGRHELRMENHRGILAYGPEEIVVSGGKLLVKIRGSELELRAMTAGELLITGTIWSVEIE